MIASHTLTLFFIAASVLTLLLSLVVIAPWLRRPSAQVTAAVGLPASVAISLMDLNVSVFHERLSELAADFESGRLDADDYAGLKADLERQLLAAAAAEPDGSIAPHSCHVDVQRPPWIVIVLVALWLPVIAFGLYLSQTERGPSPKQAEVPKYTDYHALWSFWSALDQYDLVAKQLMSGQISAPPDDALQHGLALLQTLQAMAYRHPQDASQWVVLAEGYRAADMAAPAQAALAHAHRLAPDDVGISMRYAQMRFAAQAGKMDDVTQAVLRHVLDIQPQHEGALMLLAVASYRDQQYDAAVVWLQRLKAARMARAQGQPVDPALMAQLDQIIEKAEQAKLTQSGSSSQLLAVKSSNNRALNAHQTLSITVQLRPEFIANVKPSDTLFVYVRALTGMSAPYAAQKIPAAKLLSQISLQRPLALTLSDDDQMLAGRTLSSAYASAMPLVVAARISHHDDPLPQAGDLESLPVPVSQAVTADQGYALYIDQVRP